MTLWQLILYFFASVFALRSLISLMTHHKQVYTERLLAEEMIRRQQEKKDAQEDDSQQGKADEPPEPSPAKEAVVA